MYDTEKYFKYELRREVGPIYKGHNVQMRCHDCVLSIKIRTSHHFVLFNITSCTLFRGIYMIHYMQDIIVALYEQCCVLI